MFIETSFGSKSYNISEDLEQRYGKKTALNILAKTGPKNLFLAATNESSLSLGHAASKKLVLKNKEITDKANYLFSVTESPELLFPGNASALVSLLNLDENISVFDINAGCTGFVDAIRLSVSLPEPSLIVCSETYSKHLKSFKRSVSSLFADAAAAVYFDPKDWELICSKGKTLKNSSEVISCKHNGEVNMTGNLVYDFLLSSVLPFLEEILTKQPDISRAYIHQGSSIVNETIKKKLAKYCKSIPQNLIEKGNTVSATLPILIKDDTLKNPIKSGESILLAGFGVGLSCSVCILRKL